MCHCLLSAICKNLKDIQLMIPSPLFSSYHNLKLAVVPEFLYFYIISCENSGRIHGIKWMECASVLRSLLPPHFSWLAPRNAAGIGSATLWQIPDFQRYHPRLRQRKCRSHQAGLEPSFTPWCLQRIRCLLTAVRTDLSLNQFAL